MGERAGRGAREQLRVVRGVHERGAAERGVDHAVQARDGAEHGEAIDDPEGLAAGGGLVADAPVAGGVRAGVLGLGR